MSQIVGTERNFNVRTGETVLVFTDINGLRKSQRVRYIECHHSYLKHPLMPADVPFFPIVEINISQYMQRFDIKSLQYMRAIFTVKENSTSGSIAKPLDIAVFTDNDYTFLPNNTLIGTSLVSYSGIIKLYRQPSPIPQRFVEHLLMRFYDTRLADMRIPLQAVDSVEAVYSMI